MDTAEVRGITVTKHRKAFPSVSCGHTGLVSAASPRHRASTQQVALAAKGSQGHCPVEEARGPPPGPVPSRLPSPPPWSPHGALRALQRSGNVSLPFAGDNHIKVFPIRAAFLSVTSGAWGNRAVAVYFQASLSLAHRLGPRANLVRETTTLFRMPLSFWKPSPSGAGGFFVPPYTATRYTQTHLS